MERRCQGWLLFNKLPLGGWRVPGFWTSLAQFCSAVKFVTHGGQLIPAALSLRPLPVLSSSRVWQPFALTSLLSFSEAIPQSRDAFLTNSAIQQPPTCANPFRERTEEAFHEGMVAKIHLIEIMCCYHPLISNIINLEKPAWSASGS